jgi:hypothetical protein
MKTLLLFAVTSLCLCLTACQPTDRTVRDAIAGETGFLDQAVKDHQTACAAVPTTVVCGAINRAGEARNVAIDAIEAYCSGIPTGNNAAFQVGGPCAPVKSAQATLAASLAGLTSTIKDLKAMLATEKVSK